MYYPYICLFIVIRNYSYFVLESMLKLIQQSYFCCHYLVSLLTLQPDPGRQIKQVYTFQFHDSDTCAVKSSATLALARKKHLQCYTLTQIFNSLKFDSAPLIQHCWVCGCRLSSFLRQLALHIPKFHFVGNISSVCQLIFLIRYGGPTTKSMQIIQTGNKICAQSQSSDKVATQCLK